MIARIIEQIYLFIVDIFSVTRCFFQAPFESTVLMLHFLSIKGITESVFRKNSLTLYGHVIRNRQRDTAVKLRLKNAFLGHSFRLV